MRIENPAPPLWRTRADETFVRELDTIYLIWSWVIAKLLWSCYFAVWDISKDVVSFFFFPFYISRGSHLIRIWISILAVDSF